MRTELCQFSVEGFQNNRLHPVNNGFISSTNQHKYIIPEQEAKKTQLILSPQFFSKYVWKNPFQGTRTNPQLNLTETVIKIYDFF